MKNSVGLKDQDASGNRIEEYAELDIEIYVLKKQCITRAYPDMQPSQFHSIGTKEARLQ